MNAVPTTAAQTPTFHLSPLFRRDDLVFRQTVFGGRPVLQTEGFGTFPPALPFHLLRVGFQFDPAARARVYCRVEADGTGHFITRLFGMARPDLALAMLESVQFFLETAPFQADAFACRPDEFARFVSALGLPAAIGRTGFEARYEFAGFDTPAPSVRGFTAVLTAGVFPDPDPDFFTAPRPSFFSRPPAPEDLPRGAP